MLLLLLAASCLSHIKSVEGEGEQQLLLSVTRRLFTDFYYYNGSTGASTCDNDFGINITYLVDERLCVAEEELFRRGSERNRAIFPSMTTELTTVAILDSRTSNMTYLKLADGQAHFKFNATDQSANSSFCDIASLEVFRGWEQAIEISHQGFKLSINGSIQIDKNKLAYGIEDFTGELYRMNLVCSHDALPDRGSLFFKVLGNSTVTTAKFNCAVPGTLTDFTEECNVTTLGETTQVTTLPITTTAVVAPTTTDTIPASAEQMPMIYLFVVVGCGVPILLVFALMVCTIVCLLRRRLRSQKVQTAPVPEHKGGDLENSGKQLDESVYNTLTHSVSHRQTDLNNQPLNNQDPVYATLDSPPPDSHRNSFQQRSEKNTNTTPPITIPPIAANNNCGNQVAPGNGYEAPINTSSSLKDNFAPSENVYAEPDRKTITMNVKRSASVSTSGHRNMAPHLFDTESDPANHLYHVLEERSPSFIPCNTRSPLNNYTRRKTSTPF